MNPLILPIQRIEGSDRKIPLPSYQTNGAAGMDVRANLSQRDRGPGLTLGLGARMAVPTGFAMAVPPGFEVQVRARSGRALREGLMVPNAPGTIDADYRGEVMILLLNAGNTPLHIAHGDRIAQLVLTQVPRAAVREVAELPATVRGRRGFGSTGR